MLTPTIRGVLFAFLAVLLLMGLFTEEKIPTDLDVGRYLATDAILGIPNFANLASEILLIGATLFGIYSVNVVSRRGWKWAPGAHLLWILFFVFTLAFGLLDRTLPGLLPGLL